MKDKKCAAPIKGFVGLKSKMYTFITEGNHKSKKVKGIIKNVVNDKLKYEYNNLSSYVNKIYIYMYIYIYR